MSIAVGGAICLTGAGFWAAACLRDRNAARDQKAKEHAAHQRQLLTKRERRMNAETVEFRPIVPANVHRSEH